MDSFDLNRTSNIKVDAVINKKYGGRFSKSEKMTLKGVGIGGLLHYDESDNTHLKCNIELVRNGLVVYFRNLELNKAIIFAYHEIEYISLIKETDILVAKKYSIFQKLLQWGFNYYNAKIFLLEQEIINEFKPELIIRPKEYQDFKLLVHRRNPWDVAALIQKIDHPIKSEIQLLEYEFIGKSSN